MEDNETIKKNMDSYRDSIINTLNLDASILENRINEELFDTYIDNILKNELKDKNELEILFNKIIIKLSKVKNVYDRYAFKLTNLSHNEYINKIKKSIDQKKNFPILEKYAIDYLDIDYDNEIENYIMSLYANKILKHELNSALDQEWFINYIINVNALKQHMIFKVVGIKLPKLKKISLSKNDNYKKIIEIKNYYDSEIIYINLGLFTVIKNTKGFNTALLYLINSCLLELQKHIQKSKEYSMTYDDNIYRFIKENIIYNEDNLYYDQNKKYFDSQIDLSVETSKMLNELIS